MFRERVVARAAAQGRRASASCVFRRFRQRPVETPAARSGRPTATSTSTTTSSHVALPGPRPASASCRRCVSRLASTPLDPARPLWQFHLVDNYAGGSALVARIHHCYADGIALVQVMLSMTDAAPHGPPAMPFAADARRRAPATATTRSALLGSRSPA